MWKDFDNEFYLARSQRTLSTRTRTKQSAIYLKSLWIATRSGSDATRHFPGGLYNTQDSRTDARSYARRMHSIISTSNTANLLLVDSDGARNRPLALGDDPA